MTVWIPNKDGKGQYLNEIAEEAMLKYPELSTFINAVSSKLEDVINTYNYHNHGYEHGDFDYNKSTGGPSDIV